jgi:Secretion system C-terminal sorting domain
MSKHIQLAIADPCHEDWDKMTKMEQCRFCASCQKTVMDFTTMNDSQIALYFKKQSTDSVCGRFYEDQLNRNIEIPGKHIPWVKYFFQFALPAFLVSMKATAQGKVKLMKQEVITIQEVVLPPASLPQVNSIVQMLNGKISGPVITVNPQAPDLASCVKPTPQLLNPVNMNSFQMHLGAVSVGIPIQTEKPNKQLSKSNPSLTKKLMDTAFKFFKIFPNPVTSGASLHIEWKEMEEGYYILELIDLNGRKINTQETWIDAEARVLNIEIPSVTAGNYLLCVTNKQSGKNFTEKIVIQ